jgi:hypothetical protein
VSDRSSGRDAPAKIFRKMLQMTEMLPGNVPGMLSRVLPCDLLIVPAARRSETAGDAAADRVEGHASRFGPRCGSRG